MYIKFWLEELARSGTPMRRCQDKIKLDCRMADSCEHGKEPSDSINVGNFLTNWVTISLSRSLQHGIG
jgi:hypothetical protein